MPLIPTVAFTDRSKAVTLFKLGQIYYTVLFNPLRNNCSLNQLLLIILGHMLINTHVCKFYFPFAWTDLHICKICIYANKICTWSRPRANFADAQILHVRKSGKIAFTWTDLLT